MLLKIFFDIKLKPILKEHYPHNVHQITYWGLLVDYFDRDFATHYKTPTKNPTNT
jgi:hypothetical protein